MPTVFSQFKCPKCKQERRVPAPERDVLKIFCTGEACAFWFTPDGRILSMVEADSMLETATLRDVMPEVAKVVQQAAPLLVKDYELVVWDLETTGFNAPEDRILEVGALIFKKGEAEPIKKRWVFQNNVAIPEKITEITGFTKEIIDAEGTDPKANLEEFLPMLLGSEQNVTHNGIRFDIPFLVAYAADVLGYSEEEALAMRKQLEGTAYDTAVHFKSKKSGMGKMDHENYIGFAKRIMNTPVMGVKYNLEICAKEMKIDLTGIVAHRALADVEVTYKLFLAIQKPVEVNEELPF